MSVSDGVNSPDYPFDVIVQANSPPSFASALTDKTVVVGFTISYPLPTANDPEGVTLVITATQTGCPTLPSFVTFSSNAFTISPTL